MKKPTYVLSLDSICSGKRVVIRRPQGKATGLYRLMAH